MRCNQCGAEFNPKRSTAKYCSAKCRKLAFQGQQNAKTENANAENAKNAKTGVTENAKTDDVTPKVITQFKEQSHNPMMVGYVPPVEE